MAHLKKSAATGRLLKTATGHLTKTCPVDPPPPDCMCCFGSTSEMSFSGWPEIEDDGTFGIDQNIIDLVNNYTGPIPWGTHFEYGGGWNDVTGTWTDGVGIRYRWAITGNSLCTPTEVGFEIYCRLEEETGVGTGVFVANDDALCHVITCSGGIGTCCEDTWDAIYPLGANPPPDDWYFQLTAGSATSGTIAIINNKSCMCPDGTCVDTADNSDAVCDVDGANTCTAAQDDDCPP